MQIESKDKQAMKNAIKQIEQSGRERVYSFLVDFIQKNGYSPTVREICVGTGLRSTSSVYAHLLKLEDEGKIEMKKKSTRAIKVIGFQFVKMEELV